MRIDDSDIERVYKNKFLGVIKSHNFLETSDKTCEQAGKVHCGPGKNKAHSESQSTLSSLLFTRAASKSNPTSIMHTAKKGHRDS